VGGTVKDDSLELWLSEEDRENAKRALKSGGVCEDERIIALAPGAGHPKRQWPLERFIQLGLLLLREFDARIIIVGGPGDRERASRLSEVLGRRVVSVAGQMTLRGTATLLKCSDIVIANDSGPMHLAAAAGVPVVEISCHPADGNPLHANSPCRFHPWASQYGVVQPEDAQSPCTDSCGWHDAHCILGVSVEMVFEAVRVVQMGGGTTSRLSGAPRG
jgi:heptosyltransferase-2